MKGRWGGGEKYANHSVDYTSMGYISEKHVIYVSHVPVKCVNYQLKLRLCWLGLAELGTG